MEDSESSSDYLLVLRQCMWLADLPRQALVPAARDVLGWASDSACAGGTGNFFEASPG
jgi:hypothetical protein